MGSRSDLGWVRSTSIGRRATVPAEGLPAVAASGRVGVVTVSALDTAWLSESREPWTAYRALLDLDHRSPAEPATEAARHEMIDSSPVVDLIERASGWPRYALKRHNDAAHPLYAIATLADFGLERDDPGIEQIADAVLEHFDGTGFETFLWLPRFLTKEDDREQWSWMLCDAPTLLYALLSFGYVEHHAVEQAAAMLLDGADDNGWRCGAAASLPSFSGPGRSADTCPMATTYSLKALSLIPEAHETAAVRSGIGAILDHWEYQKDYKLKMFGIGTDFRKLKYPFVWYDILHVADVLSRFSVARGDPRLVEMVRAITTQADRDGRYTPSSMYRSWKQWSFSDKQHPSPWITMLVERIQDRTNTPQKNGRT